MPSGDFRRDMRSGTIVARANNPAVNPFFSYGQAMPAGFGRIGQLAGMGMDFAAGQGLLPQFYNVPPGMSHGQVHMAAQQHLAYQQMMEYSNRLNQNAVTQGLAPHLGQELGSAVGALSGFFPMIQQLLLPGGGLSPGGVGSLSRVAAMSGNMTATGGQSLINAFNAYYGFESGKEPIAARTAGMSRDQLAQVSELAMTRRGRRWFQDRIELLAREDFDAGMADLGGRAIAELLPEESRAEYLRRLVKSKNPIASLTAVGADEATITKAQGMIRDRFDGASSFEEVMFARGLSETGAPVLAEAMEALGDGALEFINTLDNIFGRSATLQPERLRDLARQLQAVSDATGIMMGELQNVVVMASEQARMFGGRGLTMYEAGEVARTYGAGTMLTDNLSAGAQKRFASILAEGDIAIRTGPIGQALGRVMAEGGEAFDRLAEMDPHSLYMALQGLAEGRDTLGLGAGASREVQLAAFDMGRRGQAARRLSTWDREALERRALAGDEDAISRLRRERELVTRSSVGYAREKLGEEAGGVMDFGRGLAGVLGVRGELSDEDALAVTSVLMAALDDPNVNLTEAISGVFSTLGESISLDAITEREGDVIGYLRSNRFISHFERSDSPGRRQLSIVGAALLSQHAKSATEDDMRSKAVARAAAHAQKGYSRLSTRLQAREGDLGKLLRGPDGSIDVAQFGSLFNLSIADNDRLAWGAVLERLASSEDGEDAVGRISSLAEKGFQIEQLRQGIVAKKVRGEDTTADEEQLAGLQEAYEKGSKAFGSDLELEDISSLQRVLASLSNAMTKDMKEHERAEASKQTIDGKLRIILDSSGGLMGLISGFMNRFRSEPGAGKGDE